MILETVIVAIAVVGSALYPTGEVHDRPREILAYTAVHGFGGSKILSVLGALLVGAIFAKVVSTANNYLFSPATNLVNDVFVRYIRRDAPNGQVLLVSRLMVVALGAWALWQSPQHQLGARQIGLRLHHLLRRAHTGDPGGVLLASRDGFGRGIEHRRGNCRHGGLDHDCEASSPGYRRTGCNPSGAVGVAIMPVCGEPADAAPQCGEARSVCDVGGDPSPPCFNHCRD